MDHGRPVLAPICCTPIYQMADGRYILFHNTNNGRVDGCEPENGRVNRRPSSAALGEYRLIRRQFDQSHFLAEMDYLRLEIASGRRAEEFKGEIAK